MQIKLLPAQSKFLKSKTKNACFLAGVGAGKTKAGGIYALQTTFQYPKAMGGIFANTYKQLFNSTLSSFFNLLMENGITFEFNQNRGILKIGRTKILCQSLENFDAIRGVELGWAWLDEASYSNEAAYLVILGRIRDSNGPLQTRLTATPKGYDFIHDYFYGDKKTNDFELITSSTKENPYLPKEYVDFLYSNYSEQSVLQELEGQFVNVYQGRVYYAFNRKINVSNINFIKDHPIIIGQDFNINPMCGVVAQVINDTIFIIDEIRIETSNTNELAELIKSKFGTGHKIIPDSTGAARKTSSNGLSDHMILRNAGFTIPNISNPHRIDRYNCVNSLLEKKRIMIDSKCKSLINDLEKVGYKDGTNLPDTKDKNLTHISDALGYLCWYLYPLYRASSSVAVKNYI